ILATTSDGGPPRLWNLTSKSKEELKIAGLPTATGLAFAPDGETIALAVQDGPIQIRNFPAGSLRGTIGGKRHGPHFLIFTPDRKKLLDYSEWDGACRTGLMNASSGQHLWGGHVGQF